MSLGDPQVFFNLYDLSTYVNETAKGWTIFIGQAERGPCWKPMMFEAGEQFTRVFGDSVSWCQDPLVVIDSLNNGGKAIFIRITHCADVTDPTTMVASAASTLISDRGGVPTQAKLTSAAGPYLFDQAIAGGVTCSEVGPYPIVTDTNDVISISVGTTGSWGVAQPVTLTPGSAVDASAIVDEINAGTVDVTADVFNGKVRITANSNTAGVKINAATHSCYSTLGFVATEYPPIAATTSLVFSVDGGADQTFQLLPENSEPASFYLTPAQVAAQIATIAGAAAIASQGLVHVVSDTYGAASSIQCKATSTAATVLGFSTTAVTGFAGSAIFAWRCKLIGPGAFGNNAKLYIYDSSMSPGQRINARLTIPGSPEEYYSDLTWDTNDAKFWKTYINTHSELCQIVDVTEPNDGEVGWPEINTNGYVFSGGDDGTMVLSDADYLGDAAAQTGVYAVNKVQIPAIDIMPVGTSSPVVVQGYQTFVENNVGLMAHFQCPADMDPNQAVDWRMGNPPNWTHAAFDSPSLSLLFGRPTIFDVKNNAQVEVVSLGKLAAQVSKTDNALGPHWSPFGLKRGKVSGVLDLDYNVGANSAWADLLAEYGINNLRIILSNARTYGDEGAVLWGGWTTQRIDSALKEFPVSRLIKTYERMLLPVLLQYINDPNHPVTWREIFRILDPIFRKELDKYAVYGYFIQTDKDAFFSGGELKNAYLNTGSDIDQGKYRCRILIQPSRQIFYLISEMGVMRTGEPFSNYSTMYQLPGWVRM